MCWVPEPLLVTSYERLFVCLSLEITLCIQRDYGIIMPYKQRDCQAL